MAAIPSTRSSIRSSSNHSIQIGRSRSGPLFASFAGLQLNSAYNPSREAERYLSAQSPRQQPAVCIILGDTLPYLREALSSRFPTTQILSVYYHDEFPSVLREHFAADFLEEAWWPGGPSSLEGYLARQLRGVDIADLLVLEWAPSNRAFERTAKQVREALDHHLRSAAADRVTVAAFQRAWIDNLFSNFLSVPSWYRVAPHRFPILIAAPGPSLSRALPLISEHQEELFIVSLSSALTALIDHGVQPDLAVTVDAGYWARLHLGVLASKPTAVAMPLTGARGVWSRSVSPVLISSGSLIELELFRLAQIEAPVIPDTGTVAAAALELSLLLSDAPIIFAGLDLSYGSLTEHVRPHAFDPILELQADRMSPLPSITFERIRRLGWRRKANDTYSSPALGAYTAWFQGFPRTGRLFRLFPTAATLDGVVPIEPRELTAILAGHRFDKSELALSPLPFPAASARAPILEQMLTTWQHELSQTGPGRTSRIESLLETLVPRTHLLPGYTDGSPTLRDRTDAPLVTAAIAEIGRLRDRFLR